LHHALAMQKPTGTTALGDFTNARLEHFGVVTTFARSGDKLPVRPGNQDGGPQKHQIGYPFCACSQQQYLISFSEGDLHRWFHLYPDQKPSGGART
jgi:hypothetical protein